MNCWLWGGCLYESWTGLLRQGFWWLWPVWLLIAGAKDWWGTTTYGHVSLGVWTVSSVWMKLLRCSHFMCTDVCAVCCVVVLWTLCVRYALSFMCSPSATPSCWQMPQHALHRYILVWSEQNAKCYDVFRCQRREEYKQDSFVCFSLCAERHVSCVFKPFHFVHELHIQISYLFCFCF